MKIAIHQPQYFPWPPYVHKVMSADIFVYLDTVQFSKNGLQNRNQIRVSNKASWLTLPVKQKLGQPIRETEIADVNAPMKHWKTLQANYARSPGLKRWRHELDGVFNAGVSSLAELAIASTEWTLEKLDVTTKRIRASSIAEAHGHASELVASICKALSARTYLTGTGALEYLNLDDFRAIDCDVEVQQWKSLTYRQQLERSDFVPDLSTLDLLLNCPDDAAQMIRAAGSWKRLE